MAFKAVSGVNKNVYSTYTSDQTSSEKVFAALEVTNRHFNHYKNRIVLKWQDIGPTEVLYIIFYFCCHIVWINLPVKCSITCITDRVASQCLSSSCRFARGPRKSMWKRTWKRVTWSVWISGQADVWWGRKGRQFARLPSSTCVLRVLARLYSPLPFAG